MKSTIIFVSTIVAGLRLCRRAAPLLWVITSLLQLVSGLATVAVVVLGGRLVDQLVRPEADASSGLLVAFVVTTAVALGASLIKAEYQRVLAERVEQHSIDVVLDAAVHVDLTSYELPEFHDRFLRAIDSAQRRPTQLSGALLGLISTGTTIIGLGVALVALSPALLVFVAVGALPLAWAARIATKRTYAFNVAQSERDRRHDYFLWALADRTSAAEIRVFDLGSNLRRRVHRLHAARIDDLGQLARRRSLLGLVGVVVSVAIGGVVLYFLDRRIESGDLALDRATIVAAALLVLAQRLHSFAISAASVYESALFLDDIARFTAMSPRPAARSGGPIDSVALVHASFRYPAGVDSAVHDVDLELARGELVAIVGENGSGKTTLAKMLSMVYQPTSGALVVNGKPVDADEVAAADHGRRIAVVHQEYLRLLIPAGESIALGDLARVSERDRIAAAAEFGQVDAMIEDLPDGYETLLGTEFSGGHELSSGQWQRMAMARAWFRDADVIILDEPTSSLDPHAEVELIEQIRAVAKDKIVVLISHRFGTVATADRVVVLDAGRIVEEGTHEELMATGAAYARLYSAQAAQFERQRKGGR